MKWMKKPVVGILLLIALMSSCCTVAAFEIIGKPADYNIQAPKERIRYDMVDSHLHYLDFLEKSDGFPALVKAMDMSGVKSAIIFGMPIAKQWDATMEKAPTYYLSNDSRCYYYSGTDYILAEDLLAQPKEVQDRFYPFICGINGNDQFAADHIRQLLERYPDFWCGIGEIMSRHDDLTALTYGEAPHINSPAFKKIFDLGAEYDLPVLVHHNITGQNVDDVLYLDELKEALAYNRDCNIIWAHIGISRRVELQNLVKIAEDLLENNKNLYVDISWVVYDYYFLDQFPNNYVDGNSLDDWAELIEKYPDRVLIGTDKVGHWETYPQEVVKYYKLLDKLKPETVKKVTCDNALKLVKKDSDNTVSEHTIGKYSQTMTDDTAAQFQDELSAFEIAAEQRKRAAENEAGYTVLDAGRGNPNWINSKVRSAFTRLMDFANEECKLVMNDGDMAQHSNKEGISDRFAAFMDASDETDKFLIDAVDHCEKELGMDRDDLLFEFANGIIGDYYPEPSRCLTLTEQILNEYIESTLFNGNKIEAGTDIFPTEGGSAAMCYIFHSLNHNRVLKKGDKIAIGTPIFTPYLEIPNVNDYGLVSIDISADSEHDWDIDPAELDKLRDPDIKAFFLVNPSNPASHALSSATLERLRDVVRDNPDLIILTDDVYGTFVNGFESVYSALPDNTILVYSFSKLYGVTGWRTGLIAMSRNNVVDRLISELPDEDKKALKKEYSIAVSDPDEMRFIERLTADSRSIGLYHTSGLSTPSQIFMDLMALSHTTYEKDEYIEMANATVNERYNTLMNALGLEPDNGEENARYYALVDINKLITDRYGEEFAQWKKDNITDIGFLNDLASKKGVVLMYGPGFDAPEGNVRISLANLNSKDYKEIVSRMMELLDEYYEEFEGNNESEAA